MGCTIAIRVTTRSSQPGIGEWKSDPDGRQFLELRVSAAPADGAANAEVIRLLAKAIGLAKSDVSIVSGQASRFKQIELPLDEADVRARLGG